MQHSKEFLEKEITRLSFDLEKAEKGVDTIKTAIIDYKTLFFCMKHGFFIDEEVLFEGKLAKIIDVEIDHRRWSTGYYICRKMTKKGEWSQNISRVWNVSDLQKQEK